MAKKRPARKKTPAPKKTRAPRARRAQPADQAVRPGASPLTGVPPPAAHRFQPGQSGNPAGRPAAGATIREWINALAALDLTERQLRQVARDRDAPWTKRAAAERVLRTLEAPDLADMEPYLKGEATLEDLRKAGVNTEAIKKVKATRRIITHEDGPDEVEETREVQLHDRAGGDFDRICDRTDGRPTQRVDVHNDGDDDPRDGAQAAAEATALVTELAKRLGVDPDGPPADPKAP